MKTMIRCLLAIAALLLSSTIARAHCDGLDGPVVQAGEKALATSDVNLVLIWVQEADEPEIRHAFSHAQAVRKLGAEARELADRHFFETLVRIHRAGEGAAFTSLKPAGRDLGPAIPAADKALRDGNADQLVMLLTETVREKVREHFAEARAKQKFAADDVEAGRAYVKAYVQYVHYIEALHGSATQAAQGHYNERHEAVARYEHSKTPCDEH